MALYALGDLHLSFQANKPMDAFGKAWKRHEQKMRQMKSNIDKVQEIYEETLFEHCHYTMSGENSMGKILTMIRDHGHIEYDLKFPLYFFEHEIK